VNATPGRPDPLRLAGEIEDHVKGHQRAGYHKHNDDFGTEVGQRVPVLTAAEVFEQIFALDEAPKADERDLAGRAVLEVLRIILGRTDGDIRREMIGSRALCLAYTLRPDLIHGTPSLREIARRCGISAPALSVFTSELRDQFNIANGAQRGHDWRRLKFTDRKEADDVR
jgi:hypothetical protein